MGGEGARGDDEDEPDVDPGLGGVEDDDGHGQRDGDDAAHVWDEVEEEGEEAEDEGEVHAEEEEGGADEDARGGGEEDLVPDVPLHLRLDLGADGAGVAALVGGVAEEEVDGEEEHEEAVGELLEGEAEGVDEELRDEARVAEELLRNGLVGDVHPHAAAHLHDPVHHGVDALRVLVRVGHQLVYAGEDHHH